jgi:chromosome partitioning protein
MVEGFAERMIFREFYPRGLTALDDFDGVMLGTRPTMSHATARQEVASLLNSLNLGMFRQEVEALPDGDVGERDRHAA